MNEELVLSNTERLMFGYKIAKLYIYLTSHIIFDPHKSFNSHVFVCVRVCFCDVSSWSFHFADVISVCIFVCLKWAVHILAKMNLTFTNPAIQHHSIYVLVCYLFAVLKSAFFYSWPISTWLFQVNQTDEFVCLLQFYNWNIHDDLMTNDYFFWLPNYILTSLF